MVKLEDNRTLFIKLIDWLLTKFPNDKWLANKACKLGVHTPNYISYKRNNKVRYKYGCTNCRKVL
jgi:rRNA maturation endonuclease Nob1